MKKKELKVKDIIGKKTIKLGEHWSFNLYNDPKRLSFVLSRYKFAAKMASKGRRVLELGCSEGIGTQILAEFALDYTGVDLDRDAILVARRNWPSGKLRFIEDDFLGKKYGVFDTVVSLDVIEHITPKKADRFFKSIYDNLKEDGIGIVGTPNVTSSRFASKPSQLGHINMYDAERLRKEMLGWFRNVFIFGVNDEVVHSGFAPMAHYLICIGCGKKRRI